MYQEDIQTEYIQEEKIDLRKLWSALVRRKTMIFILTVSLTILAIAYVLLVKPVYEVRAALELAQINKKPVLDQIDLKQKLEYIFETNARGRKVEFPIVSSVDLPKGTSNIIVLKAQGYDNTSALEKLHEIVDLVVTIQNEELKSYTSVQKQKLELTQADIVRNDAVVVEIESTIKDYKKTLLHISKKDAALAGIYAIEVGKKEKELNDLRSRVYAMQSKAQDIELSISPMKIKEVKIIGKLEKSDFPIKPRKKLIVAAAFFAGLLLSIFLTFLLEFIQGVKKEEALIDS